MGEMRDSDWSRPNLLRSDWLPIIGAIMTTVTPHQLAPGVFQICMMTSAFDFTFSVKFHNV